jgi:hypothetical protein
MNNKKLIWLLYIPLIGIFVPFYMLAKNNFGFFDEMEKPFFFITSAFVQAASIFLIILAFAFQS